MYEPQKSHGKIGDCEQSIVVHIKRVIEENPYELFVGITTTVCNEPVSVRRGFTVSDFMDTASRSHR